MNLTNGRTHSKRDGQAKAVPFRYIASTTQSHWSCAWGLLYRIKGESPLIIGFTHSIETPYADEMSYYADGSVDWLFLSPV